MTVSGTSNRNLSRLARQSVGRSGVLRYWLGVPVWFAWTGILPAIVTYVFTGGIERKTWLGVEASCSMEPVSTAILLLVVPALSYLHAVLVFVGRENVLRTLPLHRNHVDAGPWLVQVLVSPALLGLVIAVSAIKQVASTDLNWPHAHVVNFTLLCIMINCAYKIGYSFAATLRDRELFLFLMVFMHFFSSFALAALEGFHAYSSTVYLAPLAVVMVAVSYRFKQLESRTRKQTANCTPESPSVKAELPHLNAAKSIWKMEDTVVFSRAIGFIAQTAARISEGAPARNLKPAEAMLDARIRSAFVIGAFVGLFLPAPFALYRLAIGPGEEAGTSGGIVFLAAIAAFVAYGLESMRSRVLYLLPIRDTKLSLYFHSIGLSTFFGVIAGAFVWTTFVWHVELVRQAVMIVFALGALSYLSVDKRVKQSKIFVSSVATHAYLILGLLLFLVFCYVWTHPEVSDLYRAAIGVALLLYSGLSYWRVPIQDIKRLRSE